MPYQAYLVRIWRTKRGGQEGYRAMAENVATRERRHFPDLESLFAFLEMQGKADAVGSGRAHNFSEER